MESVADMSIVRLVSIAERRMLRAIDRAARMAREGSPAEFFAAVISEAKAKEIARLVAEQARAEGREDLAEVLEREAQ